MDDSKDANQIVGTTGPPTNPTSGVPTDVDGVVTVKNGVVTIVPNPNPPSGEKLTAAAGGPAWAAN